MIGDVTGKVAPTDAAYRSETNPTTKVITTYTSKDWKPDADGSQKVTYVLPKLQKSRYLRLL